MALVVVLVWVLATVGADLLARQRVSSGLDTLQLDLEQWELDGGPDVTVADFDLGRRIPGGQEVFGGDEILAVLKIDREPCSHPERCLKLVRSLKGVSSYEIHKEDPIGPNPVHRVGESALTEHWGSVRHGYVCFLSSSASAFFSLIGTWVRIAVRT